MNVRATRWLVFLICASYIVLMAMLDSSEAGLLFAFGVGISMLAAWGLPGPRA